MPVLIIAGIALLGLYGARRLQEAKTPTGPSVTNATSTKNYRPDFFPAMNQISQQLPGGPMIFNPNRTVMAYGGGGTTAGLSPGIGIGGSGVSGGGGTGGGKPTL